MHIGRIEGATRTLGKPPGWDEEKHGTCDSLPVRDEQDEMGNHTMVSAWLPTAEEIEAINSGAPVYLSVWDRTHPPVCLWVGKPPE